VTFTLDVLDENIRPLQSHTSETDNYVPPHTTLPIDKACNRTKYHKPTTKHSTQNSELNLLSLQLVDFGIKGRYCGIAVTSPTTSERHVDCADDDE